MSFDFDFDDASASSSRPGAQTGPTPKDSTEPSQGSVRYVFKVDITKPLSSGTIGESKVIVHSVSEGGKWSTKGTMGLVTRTFGEEPEEDYAKSSGKLGDARFIAVSNRYSSGKLWICNLYAQKTVGRGAPELAWDAFVAGLIKVRQLAQKNTATVHIARLRYDIPKLNWPKAHDAIVSEIAAHGIDVFIYSSDKDDKSKYGETPHPVPAKIPAAQAPHAGTGTGTGTAKPAAGSSSALSAPVAGPIGDVLKGQNIVISGYSAAAEAELKSKIIKMGGNVQAKWKTWGAPSHFLVCETLTEDFTHVEKLGGKVVTRAYIDECQTQSRRLPLDKFIYSPAGASQSHVIESGIRAQAPADDSDSTLPATPPKRRKSSGLAKGDSIQSKDKTKTAPCTPFDFPSVFNGLTIYIEGPDTGCNPFNTRKELTRYIVAYDGNVVQVNDPKAVDIVVVIGDQYHRPKSLPSSQKTVVNPAWVWECVNQRKQVASAEYILH